MKTAIYPGTFDPITNGHIDIAKRALKIFDHLTIVVAQHYAKEFLFSAEERKELCEIAVKDIPNIDVDIWQGLLVEYVKTNKADAIVRGMRALSDFEYEFQLGMMNRKLSMDVEIVYLFPDEKYIFLSSSALKEIALLDGDVSDFVPTEVGKRLKEQLRNNHSRE